MDEGLIFPIAIIVTAPFFVIRSYRIIHKRIDEALEKLVGEFGGEIISVKDPANIAVKMSNLIRKVVKISYNGREYFLTPDIFNPGPLAGAFAGPGRDAYSLLVATRINSETQGTFSGSYCSDIIGTKGVSYPRYLRIPDKSPEFESFVGAQNFLDFVASIDFGRFHPVASVDVESGSIVLKIGKSEKDMNEWRRYVAYVDSIVNKMESEGV